MDQENEAIERKELMKEEEEQSKFMQQNIEAKVDRYIDRLFTARIIILHSIGGTSDLNFRDYKLVGYFFGKNLKTTYKNYSKQLYIYGSFTC